MSNASHRDENVADDTFSVEELYDSDDVRLLFLPPDSPYPDGFASTSSSARPALPFDKVIGNRRPSSSFGIFKYLPYELLPEVGIYLDTFDLAALAFVDRECRQFARSYQFDTLVLDYSNSSRQLVEHLVEEGGTKVEKEKRAEGGSLGRCVRRVVISTTYELFRAAHGLYPDDVLLDGKMVARAFRGYTKYMVVLASLFTHCLPNVEVVQWKDPVAMDAALFHAITSSSARSLQLERFQVRRFAPHSSSRYLRSLGGTGTLNTLHLNLLQCQWGSGIHQQCFSAAKVIYGLLELVAPTCEELLLFNTSVLPHGPPPTLPRFSRLRRLALAWDVDPFHPIDTSPLPLLLPDPQHPSSLKHLELDVLARECMTSRSRVPGLTSLVCMFPTPEDIETIEANPQLESLVLINVMDSLVLTERLLPIISFAPFHLTTLSLGWLGKSVDEKALRTIGSIVSLKRLWLTVGGRTDRTHNWLIDHTQMRRTLRGLASLEDLAFSRDSYTTNTRFESVERYYTNRYFPAGTDVKSLLAEENRAFTRSDSDAARVLRSSVSDAQFLATLQKGAWEKWHRNRMIEEARQYLETFPRLSFAYLGQWPLEISGRGVHGATPTPLSDARQRDFCCPSLRRKWGIMH